MPFFPIFSMRFPLEKCCKENFNHFGFRVRILESKLLADNVNVLDKQWEVPDGKNKCKSTKEDWKCLKSNQDNPNPTPTP